MDSLRIYRVVDSTTAPQDILKDVDGVQGRDVRLGRTFVGMLYVKPSEVEKPGWINYFGNNVDLAGIRINTAASAAVLIVSRKVGTFALTFGHGRYLLNEEVLERRFGLRATLNAIEPSMIRSIDHRRLDAVARHTREQVGRLSAINSFGVDVARDLLRAVTGRPTDRTFGDQLSGTDVLAVTGTVPLKSLADQLDRYHELSRRTSYRGSFPWVDNIEEVRGTGEREQLSQRLVQVIKEGTHERIGLAVPEIVDWSDLAGFRYSQRVDDPIFADLDLADFVRQFGRLDRLTLPDLRRARIYLGEAEGTTKQKSWPVLKCLVAELPVDDRLYVLSEGSWYQVSSDYRRQVEQEVADLTTSGIALPPYAGQTEGVYNKKAARKSNRRLALLDRQLIACGNRSQVEACDLFSCEKQMVHVKRRGASSAMSHLFAQGLVAGEMLMSDPVFRGALNELLPNEMRASDPSTPPDRGSHEIAYVILGCTAPNSTLPFFSKVTLRNAAKTLGRLGLRVTLTGLPVCLP